MNKLYVYGTLRKNGQYHPYLRNSEFIGYRKLIRYRMVVFHIIPYAFFTNNEEDYIVVEEYDVSKKDMINIDILEAGYKKFKLSNDRIIYLMSRQKLKIDGLDLTPYFVVKDYVKEVVGIKNEYRKLKIIDAIPVGLAKGGIYE